ncbi:hypothetical protein FNV43_RR18520 [Rhamnella rubrinervis]|uniref:non-specific serine/threonine protein kinase n=1 Tax=Rhamnella rubrinervis TaxID=2594499 RepID=A0A8K0DZ52_9ROSA|nr:hypothetical protein FNV43_RR18520 [Rhamnella rubrinervis]
MASIATVFLILSLSFLCVSAQQKHPTIINPGSTISPSSDKYPRSWPSPSGLFEFGFYGQAAGNGEIGFAIGVWLVGVDQITVVWTANRDHPPIASTATTLTLEHDGTLLLVDEHGNQSKLIANDTLPPATSASMLDDGNFVLYHSSQRIWESFGYPTETMVGDGNLVLYPLNQYTPIDAYWASDTSHKILVNFYLYLNKTSGILVIINGTDHETVKILNEPASDDNENVQHGTVYRATINANGIFRLYSHAIDMSNGYGGWKLKEPNLTLGCLRNYSLEYRIDVRGRLQEFLFGRLQLWGSFFQGGVCNKQKLPLRYIRRQSSGSNENPIYAFFKVGKNTTNEAVNEAKPITTMNMMPPRVQVITSKNDLMHIIVLALGLVILSCVSIAISCLYISKIRVLRYKRLRDIKGQFGILLTDQDHEDLTLRVFSYNELKRATSGFKEELGRGSFGAVYRGSLNKGRKLVAVKRLEKLIDEGEREFRAEMRAIGRTNHKNLVRLIGYCVEDSKRLLVYEYMSNGSLADLLFKQAKRPYWEERVRIAIDVAKGIHYLHEESKLLMPDQTRTFTGVRGTRGYLAPEWHKNTPITVKADVYSYGIMLELHKLVVGEDQVERRTLENMVKVGLWCIQDEQVLRPSMKSVVLMLEGITDIASPPCPTSSSSIATSGFKEELGRGSFGAVYRGSLNKGRKLVAVKRLEKLIDEGEREFRAEMRAIGRTNHKNLVRLIGYCVEDSKRLLVYEYMSNGSLADLLFKQAKRPYWEERVRIAIDVAKEGQEGIWHRKWHKNTPITVKADVYSYGIMLLEIICCRRNLEVKLHKLVVGEDQVERRTLENMVKVGLWCIQDEQVLRPSMKSVVLMLEGITDIASPPCPTSSSSM